MLHRDRLGWLVAGAAPLVFALACAEKKGAAPATEPSGSAARAAPTSAGAAPGKALTPTEEKAASGAAAAGAPTRAAGAAGSSAGASAAAPAGTSANVAGAPAATAEPAAAKADGEPSVSAAPGAAAATAAPPALDPLAALFPSRHTRSEDVTEKMQRRIRYQLRDVSPAPIALRDMIRVPRAKGGAEVYAIYEVSEYEDCVKSEATREEGRAKCLEAPVSVVVGENPEHDEEKDDSRRYLYKEVRLRRECRKYGVAYASFSPPPPGKTLDDAGALQVHWAPLEEIDCELKTLTQFFVDDVDGDKRPELYLEVISARPEVMNFRGSYADEIEVLATPRKRSVLVLRVAEQGGLERQGKLLDARISDDWPPFHGFAVHLRDLNRDGRLDVVVIGRCLEDQADDFAREEVCAQDLRERAWYLYDREVDNWVLDGDPPRPLDPRDDPNPDGGNR